MRTYVLLLLSCWFGTLQAANLTYELNEQNQLRITPSSTTATLEFEHPEMIVFFHGPCGSETCDVPSDAGLTLTYEVSGAATCDALDGNPEWQGSLTATDGQHQVMLSPIENDTVFTMLCVDAFGKFDIHQVSINVTAPGFCTTDVYPPGLIRVNGVYRNYNDGFNFGESTNASFLANISINSFLTLSDFSFPQPDSRRRIALVDAPSNFNLMAISTISISECPGDFTETATCVFEVNNNSNVFFSTRPSDAGSFYCMLDPEQAYYINYITTPDPYNEAPSCVNDEPDCAIFYAEVFMN